jgi:hypothetical protein
LLWYRPYNAGLEKTLRAIAEKSAEESVKGDESCRISDSKKAEPLKQGGAGPLQRRCFRLRTNNVAKGMADAVRRKDEFSPHGKTLTPALPSNPAESLVNPRPKAGQNAR